ncbi:hypothetical protein ACFQ4C_24135 [Larkinella insperata]|uniref:Aerotolerance regulator N-terminal domain-containing protein n=1 Tax=Larkinella insperata TaxID=332158 RepID=A0ABW3QCR6_9BACT|nr:hypothetical protein [Larkinella insperata]
MSTQFDPADPLDWIIVGALVLVLFNSIRLIAGNQALTLRRKWIRAALHLLLLGVSLAYFLQPKWRVPVDAKPVVIADSKVSADYVNHLRDSLHLPEVIRASAFDQSIRNRLLAGKIDSVILVGSDFSPDVLGQLSRQSLHWIPDDRPDQVRLIRWKAVPRKGELQTVSGTMQSSQEQVLKLRFGSQTLDSLRLKPGFTAFSLQFPVFSQGRTAVELVLNQQTLDTLRFFARKPASVSYQFILESPDFETRTLADWLGKKGYSVQLTSTLSKDITTRVSINRPVTPDVIITDPANATNPLVRKAVAQGKPVLFMNGADPEADCKAINRALGTTWQVKKISNEATVSLSSGVQALPYQFREARHQLPVTGYPVAVQKTNASIGFSLLNETFPLKLSGDSLTYDRIWTAILNELQPASRNNIQLEAPVFSGLQSVIHFNNWPGKPAGVHIGGDTVRLAYSALNGLSAEVAYRFGGAGWQPVQDSLEVYVNPPNNKIGFGTHLISAYVKARSAEENGSRPAGERWLAVEIPNWIWLLLFLGCLTALWIEPKFSI